MAKPGAKVPEKKQERKEYTRLDALSVREYEAEGEKKSAWLRIGTAFVSDDGNVKVILQAIPVDGVVHLRAPLPPKE